MEFEKQPISNNIMGELLRWERYWSSKPCVASKTTIRVRVLILPPDFHHIISFRQLGSKEAGFISTSSNWLGHQPLTLTIVVRINLWKPVSLH